MEHITSSNLKDKPGLLNSTGGLNTDIPSSALDHLKLVQPHMKHSLTGLGPAMAYAPILPPRLNDFSVNSLLTPPHFFPSVFRGPAGLGATPSFLPKLGDPHNPYSSPDFLAAHLHHRHPLQPPLPGIESSEGDTDDPQVTLESKDLWEQFHDKGTEMVITKSGR